jgi:hypothetical protein
MALRIARGLFRLWFVLSVLWIISVVALAWWVFPPAGSLDPRAAECAGKTDDECAEILQRLGRNPFDAYVYPDVPPAVDFIAKQRSAIRFAAGAALIPPITAFVLGFALSWAFKGFRSSNKIE